MGSKTEKKPWTNLQNLYKNLSKDNKERLYVYKIVPCSEYAYIT